MLISKIQKAITSPTSDHASLLKKIPFRSCLHTALVPMSLNSSSFSPPPSSFHDFDFMLHGYLTQSISSYLKLEGSVTRRCCVQAQEKKAGVTSGLHYNTQRTGLRLGSCECSLWRKTLLMIQDRSGKCEGTKSRVNVRLKKILHDILSRCTGVRLD